MTSYRLSRVIFALGRTV